MILNIPSKQQIAASIKGMQSFLGINSLQLAMKSGVTRPTIYAARNGRASYDSAVKVYRCLEKLMEASQ